MQASRTRDALALAARGRASHEPWLFHPRDGRWRWWSFARARAEVEWRRRLLERDDDRGLRPEPGRGRHDAADRLRAAESSPEALCRHLASTEGDTDRAARVFDRLLAPRAEREIVVVTPSAGEGRLARLWLEWCCANLAVLALEPSPRAFVGSVLWCRPTALFVDASQERALSAAVTSRSGGRDRRAARLLARLRVLLVAADGETANAVAADGTAVDRPEGAGVAEPDLAATWRAWGVERRTVVWPFDGAG